LQLKQSFIKPEMSTGRVNPWIWSNRAGPGQDFRVGSRILEINFLFARKIIRL